MNNYLKESNLYFNNRSIEIIQLFPSFNLARVKYSDEKMGKEITIDINFINDHIINEVHYLTIKI